MQGPAQYQYVTVDRKGRSQAGPQHGMQSRPTKGLRVLHTDGEGTGRAVRERMNQTYINISPNAVRQQQIPSRGPGGQDTQSLAAESESGNTDSGEGNRLAFWTQRVQEGGHWLPS